MDESYYRDKLSAYFDKSLPPEEMAMMDKYVQESEEARKILEEYRKLEQLIEEKSQLGGDEDYWERSAQTIEQAVDLAETTPVTHVTRKARGWLWKAVPIAASIMLLTFIGLHQSDIFEEPRIEAPTSVMTMELPPPPSTHQDTVVDEQGTQQESGYIERDALPDKLAEEDANYKVGIPKPVADDEVREQVTTQSRQEEKSKATSPAEELPSIIDKRERSPELSKSAPMTKSAPRGGEIRPTGMSTALSDGTTVPESAEDDVLDELNVLIELPESQILEARDSSDALFRSARKAVESAGTSSFAGGDYRSQKDDFLEMLSALPQREDSDIETEVPEYTQKELDSLLIRYREQKKRVAVRLAEGRFGDADYKKDADRPKGRAGLSQGPARVPEIELKRQLYESCYYVALATEDQEEFVDAITILDECARDYSNPHRDLGRDYLDMLNAYLEAQH